MKKKKTAHKPDFDALFYKACAFTVKSQNMRMYSGNKNISIVSSPPFFLNYNMNTLMFVKLLNLLSMSIWLDLHI